jgi:acetyl esterase/lipase
MRRLALLALASLALVALTASPAAAKVRTGPAGDAFYTPPAKLPGKKHGDAIWARKLKSDAVLTAAASNKLVLYRSTDANGRKIAVSGTVAVPKGKAPKGGWPVITYDHGTTGIADICAPSRDTVGTTINPYNAYIYPLLNRWLKAHYAVVRTDYQGLGTPGVHHFLVGVDEGRAALDMVRAARKISPRIGKRMIVAGHSQGGHAALWGSFLARKWTPELKLRGTVAFAPASHVSEQGSLVKTLNSPGHGLSGFLAMIARTQDDLKPALNVPGLLTDAGLALYPETETKCIPDLGKDDSFGGLAPSEIVRSDANLDPLLASIDASDPENLKVPGKVLIEQGSDDTTVFPPFTDQLATELKENGSRVTYKKYEGVSHGGIVDAAAADSTAFIKRQLK